MIRHEEKCSKVWYIMAIAKLWDNGFLEAQHAPQAIHTHQWLILFPICPHVHVFTHTYAYTHTYTHTHSRIHYTFTQHYSLSPSLITLINLRTFCTVMRQCNLSVYTCQSCYIIITMYVLKMVLWIWQLKCSSICWQSSELLLVLLYFVCKREPIIFMIVKHCMCMMRIGYRVVRAMPSIIC